MSFLELIRCLERSRNDEARCRCFGRGAVSTGPRRSNGCQDLDLGQVRPVTLKLYDEHETFKGIPHA